MGERELMTLELNKLIDSRYILFRHVASGGMADIYEAQDVILNKPVALKFLKEKYLQDPDSVEQFKNESRFVSIFNHPNILHIYNVGQYAGRLYVSYELLKGKTLKDILDNRGKISIDEALDYMSQILLGVKQMHELGILHNDLKPDNLYLLYDGTIRIVDLGAASHISSKIEKHILGTINYLAPEVVTSKKYSTQSDIYSLGIVLYELLTGEVPFCYENSKDIMKVHNKDEIVKVKERYLTVNVNDINYMINKAIYFNPSHRYKSAKEFLDDLNKIKAHLPIKKEGPLKKEFK